MSMIIRRYVVALAAATGVALILIAEPAEASMGCSILSVWTDGMTGHVTAEVGDSLIAPYIHSYLGWNDGNWGDDYEYFPPGNTQHFTHTFSHTYSTPGTYNTWFSADDNESNICTIGGIIISVS